MPAGDSDSGVVPIDQSDEALARAAQRGSRGDFGELVNRHGGRLLVFLRRRTRCAADAEDLLQESFTRAYERLGTYKPALSFRTWLYTIAWRLAVSHGRKRRGEPLGDEAAVPAGEQSDPAIIAARREQRENLWAWADAALSANQYTALWLRYAEEMSVAEVAKVMGKTRTYVKVLLFRARSRLAKSAPRAVAPAPARRPGQSKDVGQPCPAGEGGG